MLLKVGRHLRPKPHFKVIISREEGENRFLEGYRKQFISLYPSSHTGPLALIDGKPEAEDLQLAARLVARYSKGRNAEVVAVEINFTDGGHQQLQVAPLAGEEIPQEWHV